MGLEFEKMGIYLIEKPVAVEIEGSAEVARTVAVPIGGYESECFM